MKAKVTYVLQDDTEDILIIEADTIEELQAIAQAGYVKRGAKDAWSERPTGEGGQ